MNPLTDLDLAPVQRTQANYWQARYFEAYKELVNANKGLRRLRKKLDKLKPDIGRGEMKCNCETWRKVVKKKAVSDYNSSESKYPMYFGVRILYCPFCGKILNTRIRLHSPTPCGDATDCSSCAEHGKCEWVL